MASSPHHQTPKVDTVSSSCFPCRISQILTALFSVVWVLYNSSKAYFITRLTLDQAAELACSHVLVDILSSQDDDLLAHQYEMMAEALSH